MSMNFNKIAMLGLLAATASAANAGKVVVRYTPFQTGIGGEFRMERVSGAYSGEINKASDVNGEVTGDNVADNGKILVASGSDFFNSFSKGTTQAQRDASNDNRDRADFQTFCIERSEHVNNNVAYTFSIDTDAQGGGRGNGTATTTDPLGDQAAWLYTQFRNNTLSGFNMWGAAVTEAMRESSSRTLQHALWYFENELGTGAAALNLDTSTAAATMANVFPGNDGNTNPNNLNATEQAQALAWVQAALAATTGSNAWVNTNVRALNLFVDGNNNGVWDTGEQLVQTQLTIIPLPTAGGLACAGLLAMGARVRRRPI